MAVYTEVADEELSAFVARFGIGELRAAKGIAEGVENSNYLIHTSAGFYILTLYEKRVTEGDLPFFLGLMEHLSAKGIVCPRPVTALLRPGKLQVSRLTVPWEPDQPVSLTRPG